MPRYAHSVDQVRKAEAALMATLPPGTLMQRAAAGLAAACASYLGGVLRHAHPGTRGIRGQRRRRPLRGRQAGPQRSAGQRAGDGRCTCTPGAWTPSAGPAAARSTTPPARLDLVLDGIVGIGGVGGLREDAAAVVAGLSAPIVAVDVPSGIGVDTGEVCRPARRGRSHCDVRHIQGRAARRPCGERSRCRSSSSTSASGRTWASRRSRRSSRTTYAACSRVPVPRTTSTPAAWSASGPGRRSSPEPACSPPEPRCAAGWRAWSAMPEPARAWSGASSPRSWSARGGCSPGWSAPASGTTSAPCSPRSWSRSCRPSSTPTPLSACLIASTARPC